MNCFLQQEGEPRYATEEWVKSLAAVASATNMKLAAHLCSSRVNELLVGDDAFLSTLPSKGFRRVQINATAVNGVDTSDLAGSVPIFAEVITKHTDLEFILQKNEETRPLWEGILHRFRDGSLPSNVTMLVDESKGTGKLSSFWPAPPKEYDVGYAGGISPRNIRKVLEDVMTAALGRTIWIDMESSLRSTRNGRDVFDIQKCYECVNVVCDMGIHHHPSFLSE